MYNVLMTIILILGGALLIVAKVCDDRTLENKRLNENLMIARDERDTYKESAEHWFSAYRNQQKEIAQLKHRIKTSSNPCVSVLYVPAKEGNTNDC